MAICTRVRHSEQNLKKIADRCDKHAGKLEKINDEVIARGVDEAKFVKTIDAEIASIKSDMARTVGPVWTMSKMFGASEPEVGSDKDDDDEDKHRDEKIHIENLETKKTVTLLENSKTVEGLVASGKVSDKFIEKYKDVVGKLKTHRPVGSGDSIFLTIGSKIMTCSDYTFSEFLSKNDLINPNATSEDCVFTDENGCLNVNIFYSPENTFG